MKAECETLAAADLITSSECALPWARLAYGAAAILALAGLFTCWCDTPMIWDGAYQFCYSLRAQEPYKYLTRFHSYIVWMPMILLTHLTHNLTVLKWAFGLPFALAPAASVLLSWLVIRRLAPHLIIWAIFGAAAAPLPGQIFIINDSIFQQHMFWPVFLGLLLPLGPWQMLGLALLAAFQLSHQIGTVLLTGGGAAAMVLALRDREHRLELLIKSCVCFILAAVALWKMVHFPDSYAQREFTWARLSETWQWGVAGYPLRGVALMWSAGLCLLICGFLHPARLERARLILVCAATLCVVAAAINWSYWAGRQNGKLWADAVNYRRWVVPLTLPFYLLALVDVWASNPDRRRVNRAGQAPRVSLGYLIACTFALVLSIQSVVWARLIDRLKKDVERHADVIVPFSDVAWIADTPADHWGTTSYVYVWEGNEPRHVLLDRATGNQRDQLRALQSRPPLVPLSPFTPVHPQPGPAGFFDFRPMISRLRQ